MLVTKEIKGKNFKVSKMTYDIDIPAGLRVKKALTGTGEEIFYLDEFPREIFPFNSFILHDAVHYGVNLTRDEIEEKENA